jgi:uncharacterized protein (TIGR00375 family)
MKFVADFHIHSKYSRAVSPLMNLENLDKWARIKGIKVLGTGDFTHPKWFDEIKENLEPAEAGLFKFKKIDSPTRFILTAEISCIYSKGGKVRKIHIILFAPSISAVEKINKQLSKIGNLHSDGRPILGLDAKELAKIILEADKNCLLIPAHIWTPWFSIFGSKSGFNTIEECFEEYSKHIYAGETGLSSDPKMNWRLSQLDNITLISNSDSHSLQKIGREANVFNADLSYNSITDILKTKDKKRFLYTVEFFPEEGKYHYDGHRTCDISLSPKESKKNDNVCPKCKKPLVIGVLNRVEELADRAINFKPNNAIPFKSLIPLNEIIAESIGVSTASKKVAEYYNQLIKNIGSEFKILLDSSKKEIEENSLSKIAEGVMRVREGKVFIEPGYDGVYGKIEIFSKQEKENFKKEKINQKKLFS